MAVIALDGASGPHRPADGLSCSRPIRSVGFPDRRCGKCPQCLAFKAWEWKTRAMQEIDDHPVTLFVTLTMRPGASLDDKKAYADVQKWLKRLRKASRSRIRFMCAPEYGSRNGRLHYHVLLHGADGLTGKLARSLWKQGYTHARIVRGPRARHGADAAAFADYVSKYAAKDGGRVRASSAYGSRSVSALVKTKGFLDVALAIETAFPGSDFLGLVPRSGRGLSKRVLFKAVPRSLAEITESEYRRDMHLRHYADPEIRVQLPPLLHDDGRPYSPVEMANVWARREDGRAIDG